MGTLRQRQTKKTKPTDPSKATSNNNRDIHPAEKLQEVFSNRALGRLISSQSLPNQPIDNSSIQRRPLFRGLSHELTANRQGSPVQTKLAVNQVGDKYEQEADRVAAQVVKQINYPVSSSSANPEIAAIQSQKLMRKSASHGTQRIVQPDVETSIQKVRGKGQSLPENLQEPLEQAFKADFRQVRIHTDSPANHLNQSLQAKAFTTGKDIFFRQGEYQPSSQQGQELIAHELTHVVQQNNGLVQRQGLIQKKTTEDKSKVISERNGTTKTTEREQKATKGIETEIEKINKASPEQIEKAVKVMQQIGFFGESTKKTQVESDMLNYSSETSIKKSLGIENEAEFKVVMDIVNGFSAIATVSSSIGLSAELSTEHQAIIGQFKGDFKAKLTTFMGIKGSAKGEAKLGALTGLELSGEAEAKAGVEGNIEIELSGEIGNLKVAAELSGEAFAGAEAKAEGNFSISKKGISASGKAEAFAGVRASAKGSKSISYKGKVLVKLSGEVEAQAGIGGKVEGTFEFKDGKLKLSGGLSTTLGIGGGADGDIEVDVKGIGKAIASKVKDKIKNRIFARLSARGQRTANKIYKGGSKVYKKGKSIYKSLKDSGSESDE
ncbi:DUF4157 domain-containing protein [Anabaena cylindrica FACHB-243]|uniref:eCIS core domain-containing protein n=1 Tax=Anabaena cylindrica (strain ATCC 27899 / PCC 7122) TaxID=272123 RepID=K9ZB37_ANACC|nr:MULTISPECIES: DUF4157 domain-containing protein [Anabaena]AFZ55797.1 hypothetical protein Anacy_0190 [Anabaena cylindrica PCC 7122]MBD2420199.1 DUF4157 domain-containing protein [Anabaena cylindrica FACHB-243]MBY5283070.1 DUF4157 domain-containing protein [Anabaena sp. CCAP 1446/1C]MBY5311583.1 DUF4157 domain-containing protein [Anabaena sp. CCAP 1446/1C]MCM2406148.1 DUF4157 domain-containing protein [Anabaena sp. CCAP 1446/1C]